MTKVWTRCHEIDPHRIVFQRLDMSMLELIGALYSGPRWATMDEFLSKESQAKHRTLYSGQQLHKFPNTPPPPPSRITEAADILAVFSVCSAPWPLAVPLSMDTKRAH